MTWNMNYDRVLEAHLKCSLLGGSPEGSVSPVIWKITNDAQASLNLYNVLTVFYMGSWHINVLYGVTEKWKKKNIC